MSAPIPASMVLQCCLNGTRLPDEHPAVPTTAQACADEAVAAVQAGATDLHIHPRRPDGRDSVQSADVALWVQAVRDGVQVPVGVTTGAWAWSGRRSAAEAIRDWDVIPDHASVNWHEADSRDVMSALAERGVAVHVGLWSLDDVESWLESGWTERTDRVLLELADAPGQTASALPMLELARSTSVPILLHGEDRSAWLAVDLAIEHGLGLRIGLEDTVTGPDAAAVSGNAELVRHALARRNRG